MIIIETREDAEKLINAGKSYLKKDNQINRQKIYIKSLLGSLILLILFSFFTSNGGGTQEAHASVATFPLSTKDQISKVSLADLLQEMKLHHEDGKSSEWMWYQSDTGNFHINQLTPKQRIEMFQHLTSGQLSHKIVKNLGNGTLWFQK